MGVRFLFLSTVDECAASFIVEASEQIILSRLCAPFVIWPGAWQPYSRRDPNFSRVIPRLSSIAVTMIAVSFAHSASFDLHTGGDT